jgi:hypothetical protein
MRTRLDIPVIGIKRPVVSPPIVPKPIVAPFIVAKPIVAKPIVATPIVPKPIVSPPIVPKPFVLPPIVATPIVATPIVTPNQRKCLDCKITKDENEFAAIGTKGRRRRTCVECYRPPTPVPKVQGTTTILNNMTNTMNNLGTNINEVNNYLGLLNRSLIEEAAYRRRKEVEDQRMLEGLTRNLQAVTTLVEDIPRQTNDLLTPITGRINEIAETVETNREDANELINEMGERFNEIRQIVNNLTNTLPNNTDIRRLEELLGDQAENIDAVRAEVLNGNTVLGQNQANLATDFEAFKTEINNNFRNLARIPLTTTRVQSPAISPPITQPITPTGRSPQGGNKYSEAVVAIDLIRILSDDDLERTIKNLARLSSHYKGKQDKIETFQIIRANLENLRNEKSVRQQARRK